MVVGCKQPQNAVSLRENAETHSKLQVFTVAAGGNVEPGFDAVFATCRDELENNVALPVLVRRVGDAVNSVLGRPQRETPLCEKTRDLT